MINNNKKINTIFSNYCLLNNLLEKIKKQLNGLELENGTLIKRP